MVTKIILDQSLEEEESSYPLSSNPVEKCDLIGPSLLKVCALTDEVADPLGGHGEGCDYHAGNIRHQTDDSD